MGFTGWIMWPVLVTFGIALWWTVNELNQFFDEELEKVNWERLPLTAVMCVVWPIGIPYYLVVLKPKLRKNRRSQL